ncbi:MAG: translation initiation factor, partial [Bacteroidota bacterium]
MALKLIKVAKEFNVGLHTIVETLHSKGFTHVEDKPTAEITDEMLAVLNKEFQKDLAIKQEADKLARPVLKKEPVNVETPAETPPPPPAPK